MYAVLKILTMYLFYVDRFKISRQSSSTCTGRHTGLEFLYHLLADVGSAAGGALIAAPVVVAVESLWGGVVPTRLVESCAPAAPLRYLSMSEINDFRK